VDLPLMSVVDGCSLVLTIDRDVQRAAEEILEATVLNQWAEKGSIIIVEPRTGAILAMANYPSYDPNDPESWTSPEILKNPAISEVYEPGSVFKVVTFAAALDSGLISPESTLYDPGFIEIGGITIRNFDEAVYGYVTATESLVNSINVVAAEVNLSLGAERFYNYVSRFGFEQMTGVDLEGEERPLVRKPSDPDWREADLGTNSFGQGIAVTPLHMTMAIAAVANKGLLMKPYVVSKIICGQDVYEVQPVPLRQVVSISTAETLTRMLVQVVERWSDKAGVPGYTVAGKTGTAQVPIPGGYSKDLVITSFAGYLPAYDPKAVILVKIDKPRVDRTGLDVAAPAFRELALRILPLLSIPPDKVATTSAE